MTFLQPSRSSDLNLPNDADDDDDSDDNDDNDHDGDDGRDPLNQAGMPGKWIQLSGVWVKKKKPSKHV